MRTLIVVMLLALTACEQSQTPSYDSAAVRSGVTVLVQRWSDAGEAGDWDAIADTYANAEGFAWIERGEVRYPDHAAVVAGLQQARDSGFTVTNDVSDSSARMQQPIGLSIGSLSPRRSSVSHQKASSRALRSGKARPGASFKAL